MAIVSAPVSFSKINSVLGTSHTDEHYICRDDNIKRLSKFRPIRDNIRSQSVTPQQLTDADFINRDMGYLIPTFNGSDFDSVIKGIINDAVLWDTTPSSIDENTRGSIGNGWIYCKPIVGTNFARITDFENYDHDADNSYRQTTYEIIASAKNVVAGGSYTARFFVKMNPFSPCMFRSLIGYRLGVAIFSPNISSGYVHYYIGSGSSDASAISSASISYTDCSVIMPSTLFNTIINKASGNDDIVFYAVGFFAPAAYAGYQNINSSYSGYQNKPSVMTSLKPIAGNGWDTFIWRASSTNISYLAIEASGVAILPQQTSSFMQLHEVTNTYSGTLSFIMHVNFVHYTWQLEESDGTVVYEMTSKTVFLNSSETIDVTNQSAGVYRSVDLDSHSITRTLYLPNRSYAVDGRRVHVFLWYPKGVNPTTANSGDLKKCGEFYIPIGFPQIE